MAFESCLSAFREGLIHPVAWRAFLRAEEADALHLKFDANEGVEVDVACDDVAAKCRRRHVGDAELLTQPLILFLLEKSDLAIVVLFPSKEAVSAQALTCHAFDLWHLHHRCGARWLAVVAKEIVFG